MKKISLLFVLCASSLYVTAQTQKADKLQVNTTASIGSGAATTATVNIKGADALAASTALSVQNSASTTALSVNNAGQTLLGTATVPTGGTTAKFIVDNGTTNGALQIKDGTQGVSKVLVSDNDGVGTWKNFKGTSYGVSPPTNLGTVPPNTSTAAGPSVTLPKGIYLVQFIHGYNWTSAANCTLNLYNSSTNALVADFGYIPLSSSQIGEWRSTIITILEISTPITIYTKYINSDLISSSSMSSNPPSYNLIKLF